MPVIILLYKRGHQEKLAYVEQTRACVRLSSVTLTEDGRGAANFSKMIDTIHNDSFVQSLTAAPCGEVSCLVKKLVLVQR